MLKGWKTFAYGAVIILLSIFSSPDVQAFIGEHLPAVGSAVGTIVIVLRAITNSSIFKNTSPAPLPDK